MTDKPETPPSSTEKPVAPRRRAPRKAASTPAAGTAKAASASATTKAPAARATVAATPVAEAKPKRAAKPRATSRSAARPTPKPIQRVARAPQPAPRSTKPGSRWGIAAIAGGVAVAGAAAAALLGLRGSSATPRGSGQPDRKPTPSGGAHQADGSDSSTSFAAGIADEGTIPDEN